MLTEPTISILASTDSQRGDLFGRLMSDLFVALGYHQPRLNIQRSGRELDLIAKHRLEPRRAVAECKATSAPSGGADLNKFVGSLDADAGAENEPATTGYFISLNGFTETAIDQEKKRRTQIITLDGKRLVDELVRGRALVSRERAAESAGRCSSLHQLLVLDEYAHLLAHDRGWIWALYFTEGGLRRAYALVHADGTPLVRELAETVVATDRLCGGVLHTLNCLNPRATVADQETTQAAISAYRHYLSEECGFIQLDGLPADTEVGSRRLRLESLFVPLQLDLSTKGAKTPREKRVTRPQSVGRVLKKHWRLAILAPPGGGKSTLLKRLAVAYGDPARREVITDNLPKRECLPIFIRCRELRTLARGSFGELIEALSNREPIRQYATAFRRYVDHCLVDGRVLLLVDGLDEIPDQGDRAAFVSTLRTALQAYPNTGIMLTSREAGFRHVAAHLAGTCSQATLAPFAPTDIRRLVVSWFREVVGNSEKVQKDAALLAESIIRNDRIRQLAVNPLLLTTLLLVKRWVGSLPTRRAVLYGKAVEVLLMTWNTEGHKPLPEEEALPQLCFVAASMMLDGIQKISRSTLTLRLQEARDALPTELGYVTGSVEDFIHRVEDRSSLLMMTGHNVEAGTLVEFFEFRHLTFQEFLAAKGFVQGWYPDRRDTDTLADVLESHFTDPEWAQVVPLAAVLGGKATEALIQRLTKVLEEVPRGSRRDVPTVVFEMLAQCLSDEAAARPETIRAAVRQFVHFGSFLSESMLSHPIFKSRYASELHAEAVRSLESEDDSGGAIEVLTETVWAQTEGTDDLAANGSRVADQFITLMQSPAPMVRCQGALGCMMLCYRLSGLGPKDSIVVPASELKKYGLERVGSHLATMMFHDQDIEQLTASWALSWLGECQVWVVPATPDILGRLCSLWLSGESRALRQYCAWAVGNQVLPPKGMPDTGGYFSSVPEAALTNLFARFDSLNEQFEKPAALCVAWIRGEPWSNTEIAQRAGAILDSVKESSRLTQHRVLERLAKLETEA